MGRDADPLAIRDYSPAWASQFADLSGAATGNDK